MIPYILLILALLSYFLYFNNKIEKFASKKVKKRHPLQKKKYNKSKNTNYFKKSLPKPFIASNTFQGAKVGYIFKKDHQGIGYYLDTK